MMSSSSSGDSMNSLGEEFEISTATGTKSSALVLPSRVGGTIVVKNKEIMKELCSRFMIAEGVLQNYL